MSFFRNIDPLSSWKVCFGHRHADCKHAYTLKSSIDLWARKFSENVDWDRRIAANQETGWRVITVRSVDQIGAVPPVLVEKIARSLLQVLNRRKNP